MSEGEHVDQREYGELIATVKHLSGAVESLQTQYATESGKLHARLDQMMQSMATKDDHETLQHDVRDLWSYSRTTREMVADSSSGLHANQRWIDRLIFATLGIVATMCAAAAKIMLA